MPARKRGIDEVDSSVVAPAPLDVSPRHKIRNCWQFAALMQYIFFFGQAVKIDQNLDIDVCHHYHVPLWAQQRIDKDADAIVYRNWKQNA